jgi:hypothetical protein
MTEAKVFGTFNIIYFQFKSEPLSSNIKFVLHKALISSEMTYACTAWELAADMYLLKFQRLQNSLIGAIGNILCAHRTAICTCLSTFRTYVYYYETNLCRQQLEVIHNYENEHDLSIRQGEADEENM